jgi:hypothetical protein
MSVDRPDLAERVTRCEERQNASDRANQITAQALDTYKAASNEWRQALNDNGRLYVTRAEVIAIVSVMLIGMSAIVAIVGVIIAKTR